jgi:hypothetical protein
MVTARADQLGLSVHFGKEIVSNIKEHFHTEKWIYYKVGNATVPGRPEVSALFLFPG